MQAVQTDRKIYTSKKAFHRGFLCYTYPCVLKISPGKLPIFREFQHDHLVSLCGLSDKHQEVEKNCLPKS